MLRCSFKHPERGERGISQNEDPGEGGRRQDCHGRTIIRSIFQVAFSTFIPGLIGNPCLFFNQRVHAAPQNHNRKTRNFESRILRQAFRQAQSKLRTSDTNGSRITRIKIKSKANFSHREHGELREKDRESKARNNKP